MRSVRPWESAAFLSIALTADLISPACQTQGDASVVSCPKGDFRSLDSGRAEAQETSDPSIHEGSLTLLLGSSRGMSDEVA